MGSHDFLQLSTSILTLGLVAAVVAVLGAVAPPAGRHALCPGFTRPLELCTVHQGHRTILWRKRKLLDSCSVQGVSTQNQQHLLVGSIPAVLLAVTPPLLQQTFLTVGAAQFGGADRRVAAALLIRAIPAVRVTVAEHRGRHALSAGTLELGSTAALVLC